MLLLLDGSQWMPKKVNNFIPYSKKEQSKNYDRGNESTDDN